MRVWLNRDCLDGPGGPGGPGPYKWPGRSHVPGALGRETAQLQIEGINDARAIHLGMTSSPSTENV